MATTEEQVSLNLVVNKDTNKVLFAEAKKDFVDILCSFLTLPLGTIIRLVENESNTDPVTIGSLNSLYHSVAALDGGFRWRQGYNKQMLLRPRNTAEEFCKALKVNIDDTPPRERFAYRGSFSECSQDGFVNDAATFVITDDLVLMPKSGDYPRLAILHDLGIKGPFSLKEIKVDVTKKKVLDLLKCSLLSESCLTDLLLEKKPLIQRPKLFSGSVEKNGDIKFAMKLYIRKSDGKVLCGLGGKEIANMLLSFLTFPLGGVVRKLGGNSSVGSIDGLYKSIVDMNDSYFMSKLSKNRLVDPYLLLLMSLIDFGSSTTNEGNVRLFVITDDLVVTLYSPSSDSKLTSPLDSSFLFQKEMAVNIGQITEKIVSIGLVECLNILKASLTSTSALTVGLAHLLSEFTDLFSSHDDENSLPDASSEGVPSSEESDSSSSPESSRDVSDSTSSSSYDDTDSFEFI